MVLNLSTAVQVKLSCAKIITTPYYLILDTDVLFIKQLTAQQLFKVSPCSHLSRVCDTSRHRAFQGDTPCQLHTAASISLHIALPNVAANLLVLLLSEIFQYWPYASLQSVLLPCKAT